MIGPGEQPLTRAAARRRARLHRRASRDLGGRADRRRSAGAVAAPAASRWSAGSAQIGHVKVIRVHTRVPVADPARITPELVRALKAKGKATYVVLHANHARELTDAAREACARLVDAGIPMLSQSVLLARRQRRSADARRADARAGRMPHQAVLPAPRRSRARHLASAHHDRARPGADAGAARPRCPACASRPTCSTFPAATASRRSARTTSPPTAPGRYRVEDFNGACIAIRRPSMTSRAASA